MQSTVIIGLSNATYDEATLIAGEFTNLPVVPKEGVNHSSTRHSYTPYLAVTLVSFFGPLVRYSQGLKYTFLRVASDTLAVLIE